MRSNIKIGKFWGIPIQLHISWFLAFAIFTFSLASGFFPTQGRDYSTVGIWVASALTTLLFFGSVLAHELGHVWVARRNHIPVRAVTLFIFGGVAEIRREPETPGAEFRMAIAGPLVSLALFGLFWGLSAWVDPGAFIALPLEWLQRVNLSVAVFNMIPGFPLDGGRVLRSILWKLRGDLTSATRIAASGGQIVAFGFMGLGAFSVLQGDFSGGIWLGFIGWFLQNAASTGYKQTALKASLQGVRVADVMDRDLPQVPGLTSLRQLVDQYVLPLGKRIFLVTDDDLPLGFLTLSHIGSIPRRKWPFVTALEAMKPWSGMQSLDSDTDVWQALRMMDELNIPMAPVVDQGRLVGVVSRDEVARRLQLRSELGM
jgi:Zn-dependent protease/CBS domain-containing protein